MSLASAALLRLLVALAFVLGLLVGGYLTASVREGHAQSAEVAGAIHVAAVKYGVSESWMRRIAWCESRFSPAATSRGGHMGLYQYHWRTWATFSQWAGQAGASPYDPWAAADVTAWALAHHLAHHWSCR